MPLNNNAYLSVDYVLYIDLARYTVAYPVPSPSACEVLAISMKLGSKLRDRANRFLLGIRSVRPTQQSSK